MLVVDDNARARQALAAYLSVQSGITVVGEASNGEEAINLIGKQAPDLILMDVRMPVMDGMEATRIIKREWPRVKILILSMHEDLQAALMAAGADTFLVKGCPEDEMMACIRRLLLAE